MELGGNEKKNKTNGEKNKSWASLLNVARSINIRVNVLKREKKRTCKENKKLGLTSLDLLLSFRSFRATSVSAVVLSLTVTAAASRLTGRGFNPIKGLSVQSSRVPAVFNLVVVIMSITEYFRIWVSF